MEILYYDKLPLKCHFLLAMLCWFVIDTLQLLLPNSAQGSFPSSCPGVCVPTAPGAAIQPGGIPLQCLDASWVENAPFQIPEALVLLHPHSHEDSCAVPGSPHPAPQERLEASILRAGEAPDLLDSLFRHRNPYLNPHLLLLWSWICIFCLCMAATRFPRLWRSHRLVTRLVYSQTGWVCPKIPVGITYWVPCGF